MNGFMFNVFGLLNTSLDNSVYNVRAIIGTDYTTNFDKVDWNNSNQRQFKFNYPEEFKVNKGKVNLNENSCIVF